MCQASAEWKDEVSYASVVEVQYVFGKAMFLKDLMV